MNRRKKRILWVAACVLLLFSAAWLSGLLISGVQVRQEPLLVDNLEQFRQFDIAAEQFLKLEPWTEDSSKKLAVSFLYNGGKIKKEDQLCHALSWYSLLMPEETIKGYEKVFHTLLADAVYFPVAQDRTGRAKVRYGDSWGGRRTYGGDRRHEGTDLMSSNKERGYFPIVSVSDGVVEKKGWLNLGGYRLGIRAPNGAYFYYAHLDHYADGMEEGMTVKAGELIGFMGDSGYGEEGTVGKFDVHLHFGVYLDIEKKETSVNPYQLLRYLEKKPQIPFERVPEGVHTDANV
ncbi:MAG: M23 family metallopeptidase [Lachnospiraceae bacterium]|nr:M23 family metallopeptidase [Lachnospiraceae bacterium]